MKNLKVALTMSVLMLMGCVNSKYKLEDKKKNLFIPKDFQISEKEEIKDSTAVEKVVTKNHNKFLFDMGFQESSNRYGIVNRFGYMGKYQFHKNTLKDVGIIVDRKTFLSSPKLQEKAMYLLLKTNNKRLKWYINKYEGKIVHGVLITKSGVLAAAHLGGAGNVKKFFKYGMDFADGNGTKITYYMEKFSGYELNV